MHRDVFERSANIVVNSVPGQPEHAEFGKLNRKLVGYGVSRITYDQGCVVFSFATMPPDAIEEILWAPEGFKSVPLRVDADGRNTLFNLTYIDWNWFYVQRD